MSYNDLTIKSVETTARDFLIYFVGTKNCLSITCKGDCCSSAFIIFPKNFNTNTLIGKKILDITTLCYQQDVLDEEPDKSDEKTKENQPEKYYEKTKENQPEKYYDKIYKTSDYYDGDYESHTEYYFIFDDETSQKFLLYGLSNGYYGAFLSIDFIKNEERKEQIITNNVTFIIGLPGSGKTSLIKEKFSSVKVYDDFLSNINSSSIINWMQLHTSSDVVFSDPRFTNVNTFKAFIKSYSSALSKSKINLIMFDNNPEKCKKNIKNRQCDYKSHLVSLNSLKFKYNPDNEVYTKYPITQMEVFGDL